MKAQSKTRHQRAPRRSFVCVALLVICALLTHSLDNCEAHIGDFRRFATDSQQIKAPCPNGAGPCELCAPTDKPHSDLCDLLSEIAVLTSSSQHQIEHQPVTLAATVAVIPAMLQLIALSLLHNRAGPPHAASSHLVSRRLTKRPLLSQSARCRVRSPCMSTHVSGCHPFQPEMRRFSFVSFAPS